jgi:hypothetical protein
MLQNPQAEVQETAQHAPRAEAETRIAVSPGTQGETAQGETADSFEAIMEVLATERRKRDRKTLQYQRAALGIFALMVFAMIASAIRTGSFPWEMLNSFSSMAGLVGITAGATLSQKRAARSLAQFEDVRSVGPLAEALEFGDREVRAVAVEALIRLLPKLQASDASLLDDVQRGCLRRALSKGAHGVYVGFTVSTPQGGCRRFPRRGAYGFHPELAVAVLQALEQVGDDRDLAAVQSLADGKGRSGKLTRVREAAQRCLPYLQQRADERRTRQTLLRASGLSETPADLLVRPVAYVPGNDLELLRACLQDGTPVTDSNTELMLAILSHLETTGDARARPYVEQIVGKSSLAPAVREAAQRCLRTLAQDDSGSLLVPHPDAETNVIQVS